MRNDIYNFWKNNSLANIKPNTGEEFPEGWDVVEFFKNFRTVEQYGEVTEIGCGYGRLCKAFDSEYYVGLDISEDALDLARKLNPNYEFEIIPEERLDRPFPHSRTKLLYTVLLHQSDEDISETIKKLCETTRRIIVAEICGRKWRRKGNPPVFNREVEEYVHMFNEHGKHSFNIINKPYKRYAETDISIMVFS